MTAGWIGVIAGALALIGMIWKQFFSDVAAKQKKEDEFQAKEKAHQGAVDSQIQANESEQPSLSAGAASAWDAIDRDGES